MSGNPKGQQIRDQSTNIATTPCATCVAGTGCMTSMAAFIAMTLLLRGSTDKHTCVSNHGEKENGRQITTEAVVGERQEARWPMPPALAAMARSACLRAAGSSAECFMIPYF